MRMDSANYHPIGGILRSQPVPPVPVPGLADVFYEVLVDVSMATKRLAVGIVLVLILVGVLSAFKVFGAPREALSVPDSGVGGCEAKCRAATVFCRRNIKGNGEWKPYNPEDIACPPIEKCLSGCAVSGSPDALGWHPIEFTDDKHRYTTNGKTFTKQPRQGSKHD